MNISFRHRLVKYYVLLLTISSCSTIRNATEDYTVNYSRSTRTAYKQKKIISHRPKSKTEDKKSANADGANQNKVKFDVKKKIKVTKSTPKSNYSDKNRRDVKSSSLRNSIVKYSSKFDGTRYKYGGKNPFGFDCSGFTSYVFKKYDQILPPSANLQSTYGDEIELESVNKGDLLFFNIEGTIGHVALVVEHKNGKLLIRHAASSTGVIKEDFYKSDYWQKRFSHAIDVIGDD